MKKPPLTDALPHREPKAPLAQLDKWPTAWRMDSDCLIDGVLYPAPETLDANDLAWWLDYIEGRLSFSRNLANGLILVAMGVLFGLIPTIALSLQTGSPWLTAVSALMAGGAVLFGVIPMIRDSEHRALEQRWLAYRDQARHLAQGGQGPLRPSGSDAPASPAQDTDADPVEEIP